MPFSRRMLDKKRHLSGCRNNPPWEGILRGSYRDREFKTRYRNHLSSFKDPKKKNATELSKHIWRLKENNIEFTITWEIVARAKPYSNSNKKCNLCTTEKYFILCEPHRSSLNKRNELTSTCRHANAYLLKHA